MNQQKLNELEEQAWAYQMRVYNEPDGSRTYGEKERVFSREKFAELIVQECAHVGYNAAYPAKGVEVSVAIKQHFGIEE